jgi:hypothetical protein
LLISDVIELEGGNLYKEGRKKALSRPEGGKGRAVRAVRTSQTLEVLEE